MQKSALRITCLFSILSVLSQAAWADNWPAWRGLQGDGTSLEKNVPIRWSETENIAWKVELPYGGHSSPIIWDDRVFVVGADTEKENRVLMALDRKTGKVLWERIVLHSPLEGKHNLNSWASSTPATDGKLIYVTFLDEKNMHVATYDFDGKEVWKAQPGIFSSKHGYCSSPVLFKDKVIINGDHDGDSYLVALSRKTGKTLWKTPRKYKTRSYCTPIIREINGRTQMMLSGSKCIASYDPHDGSQHWIIDGPTEQFVASPVFNHGLLFITGGFPDHHILTVDPKGSGNVTDTHIVWHEQGRSSVVSYVPSPVAAGDYFFLVSDRGTASCFDARTGDVKWREQRIGKHYSGSLMAADGLVYFLADNGTTKVVRAEAKYEVVAENKLGEFVFSSPAISQGQIFIRGEKHLFCIGK